MAAHAGGNPEEDKIEGVTGLKVTGRSQHAGGSMYCYWVGVVWVVIRASCSRQQQQQQLKPSSSRASWLSEPGRAWWQCWADRGRAEREAAAAAFQRCPARAQVRAVGPIDRRTGPRVDWLLRAWPWSDRHRLSARYVTPVYKGEGMEQEMEGDMVVTSPKRHSIGCQSG